jgi:transposase-like protein
MERRGRYPLAARERGVRLVFEQQESHGSQWVAIPSIAPKLGCAAETLRSWCAGPSETLPSDLA